jgi:hypothetical protein
MPLVRKYIPVVETRRLTEQMPFSYKGCTVTIVPENLRQCLLTSVEVGAIITLAIEVRVLAGKDYGATGTANRIRNKGIPHYSAFATDTVYVRCFNQLPAICTDGLVTMIIRHDEDNVRLSRRSIPTFLSVDSCYCFRDK